MAQHTPGRRTWYLAAGPDDIADVRLMTDEEAERANYLCGEGNPYRWAVDKVSEAAPDLLAALINAKGWLDPSSEAARMAAAAIAKATGGAL